MFTNLARGEAIVPRSNVRIEEHSGDEEILSNTSSSNITETEEHVTVHSKREPLPWSLRGAGYDKPLPGISRDLSMSPDITRPTISHVQKSPVQTFGGDKASPLETPNAFEKSIPKDLSNVSFQNSPTQSNNTTNSSLSSSTEQDLMLIKAQAPLNSPSPLSIGDKSNSSSMESGKLSPTPIPNDLFNTNKHQSNVDIETASSTRDDYSSESLVREPSPAVSLGILEAGLSPGGSPVSKEELQKSNVSTASLNLLEEGLSPKTAKPIDQAKTKIIGTFSSLFSSIGLGEKRKDISTSPIASPTISSSPVLKHAKMQAYPLAKLELMNTESMSYRKDWKVNRMYRSEQFYFWRLFNPDRLQYLKTSRHRRSIPKKYRVVAEDVDLGARYRRYWQSTRRYNVCDYFNPQLFDAGHLNRIHTPMTRNQRRRHFKKRMAELGITDFQSPAAKLRLNWTTSRAHSVETFFESNLFDRYQNPWDAVREDWYNVLGQSSYLNYNPMLDNEAYNLRKQRNFQFMSTRIASGKPYPYALRIKKYLADPGQKYRDDWKSYRQNQVYLYFDPDLFNERRALEEIEYWKEVIAKLNKRPVLMESPSTIAETFKPVEQAPLQYLSPVESEHVTISVAPTSPTLLAQAPTHTPSLLSQSWNQTGLDQDDSLAALFEKLMKELGSSDDKNREYDWQFWKDCLLDCQNMERTETISDHLSNPAYASLPIQLLPYLWEGLVNKTDHGFDVADAEVPKDLVNDMGTLVSTYDLTPKQTRMLMRVLSTYHAIDKDVAYCKAMGTIAAPLVKLSNDEGTVLAALIDVMYAKGHRNLLNDDGIDQELFIFEALLVETDPELASHLAHHGVQADLYAREWYQMLFPNLSPELQAQFLTLFFIDGHICTHQFALALVVENREELLTTDTFPELLEILFGNLEAAHPDWTVKDWIELTRAISINLDQLGELSMEYENLQQAIHEAGFEEKLQAVNMEQDILLGCLGWIHAEIRRVCQDRESLHARILERQHDCKGHIRRIYQQGYQIQTLETEINKINQEHNEEVGKLLALLNASPNYKESHQSNL